MDKKNHPLVSIIVPTYNQMEYIETCLDSIMHQSYTNSEIIIVNDNSQDKTDEILKGYLQNLEKKHEYIYEYKNGRVQRKKEHCYPHPLSKITYLKNRRNMGATFSYNLGFSEAKGEYVTFIPSDDIILPNHISRLADALKRSYDFAYSDFLLVDDKLRINFCYRLPDYNFDNCFSKWYRIGPAHLFKRKIFTKAGGFDINYRYANDYDLFLRFAMMGAKFIHIPEILYYKRSHAKRRKGQWKLENYKYIIEESIMCAKRARKFKKIS